VFDERRAVDIQLETVKLTTEAPSH
jgi:hypothetical protein